MNEIYRKLNIIISEIYRKLKRNITISKTYNDYVKRANQKYFYLKPHYRVPTAIFDEVRKYASANYSELNKVWEATDTNWKKRPDKITFKGSIWERIFYLTKSRSGKSKVWVVYFKSEKTGEEIYRNMSPYERGGV